jgi:hypothetical protein
MMILKKPQKPFQKINLAICPKNSLFFEVASP